MRDAAPARGASKSAHLGGHERVLASCCALLLACSSPSSDSGPTPAPSAPSTAPWTAGTPLPLARFEAYSAVARGRVHFIGGITGNEGAMETAQPSRLVDVLDPAVQVWTEGPALPEDAPKHHLSVAVWNDAIYVLGGFDGILGRKTPFLSIAVAYVLDPGATAWRRLAPPPLARGGATAQAIDGRIYVTGGAPNEGEPSFDQLDIYEIATDRWTKGASLPTAREHLASCATGGTMIVVGGWILGSKPQGAAEQYDPRTDRWKRLPDMPTRRGGLGAVAIGATCHVVGGEDWLLPLPGTFNAHEIFDVPSGQWVLGVPMPTARHGLGLAWLDGTLYAIGGGPRQGNSYLAVVETQTP